MLTSVNVKVAVLDIQPLTYPAREYFSVLLVTVGRLIQSSTFTTLRQDGYNQA